MTTRPKQKKSGQENKVSPRWEHRQEFKARRVLASSQFKLFDPMGMIADKKAIKPQPYPNKKASFYFKPGKRFSIVHQGKIGTFEQWANELGLSVMTLRERIRECGMTLEEALVPDSLIKTDHSLKSFRAYKYCPCENCVLRRQTALQKSLKPLKTANREDKGRLFQRSDLMRLVKIDGELLDLNQISEKTSIPYKTLYARLFRYGWTIDRSISEPIEGLGRGKRLPKNQAQ